MPHQALPPGCGQQALAGGITADWKLAAITVAFWKLLPPSCAQLKFTAEPLPGVVFIVALVNSAFSRIVELTLSLSSTALSNVGAVERGALVEARTGQRRVVELHVVDVRVLEVGAGEIGALHAGHIELPARLQ